MPPVDVSLDAYLSTDATMGPWAKHVASAWIGATAAMCCS